MDDIARALAGGKDALNEYESKRLLAAAGIPVCREALAEDAEEAAKIAAGFGYPVVLKAAGSSLYHKTEVGGIALNLKGGAEIREEGKRLLAIPGCEAILVQEMVPGNREIVCGLLRDVQFGPCVMFGLGGIFTELLQDVVFRVAPLAEYDAMQMMADIRTAKVLDPFRGEAAVDRKALAQALVSLGQIGLSRPEVEAIDINPLKIRKDGSPVAVDALVKIRKAT
ncbi:MAG: succinyl-CoA synthetase subunit beta [Syntrophaceae bacterium PtaU1.Bin231]|nr:MAG: succinyl-CoA synthetase subunit beta [Syntrophaceae bacterium PtaU1.Bin231]HOG17505.1 acetate--CoA ligase family protein [Syntrophales bacterium]